MVSLRGLGRTLVVQRIHFVILGDLQAVMTERCIVQPLDAVLHVVVPVRSRRPIFFLVFHCVQDPKPNVLALHCHAFPTSLRIMKAKDNGHPISPTPGERGLCRTAAAFSVVRRSFLDSEKFLA